MEIVHDEPRRVMAVGINVPVPFPVGWGVDGHGKRLQNVSNRNQFSTNIIRYLEGIPKHTHSLKHEPEVRLLNSSSIRVNNLYARTICNRALPISTQDEFQVLF